jgi:hypothetical protein
MGEIQRIGANTFYLKQGEAVVSFTSSLAEDCDKGQVKSLTPPGGREAIEIMTWGKDNNLPQLREALVTENNIVPALMERKRNILVGNGLFAFRKRYEKGQDGKLREIAEQVEMPAATQEWIEQSSYVDVLEAAAGELVKHSLFLPEYVRDKGGKIRSVEMKECKCMRSGKKDVNGKVSRWYWSGHWGARQLQTKEEKKTVALDLYTGEEKRQLKFITAHGDFLFNDGYYPIPTYWGSREWIEMANDIPAFHKANFKNGYNLRWHVKIPADYFLDYQAWQAAQGDDDAVATVLKTAKEKEEAFMKDINQFLAGLANAGRTVFTKLEYDELEKKWRGIEIQSLQYDMKDEALLKLFDKSNTANISAQGIHPTLANIETQGKLSSGTEIRNAFLMWLIINTSKPRRHMLAPLNLVKKVNGWDPDIHFGIQDYELTALSSNDSGMQKRQEPVTDAA